MDFVPLRVSIENYFSEMLLPIATKNLKAQHCIKATIGN